ncbi:hypothetical protein PLCT1_02629 [Planctomycetaceae bacterium]|nr:hypothetical protein PLCT1_02629 [Planctomycetaceae bacterium]
MDVRRAITTVIFCSALFAFAGASVGAAIGAFMPGYYYSLFSRASQNPAFDPIEVGTGLGLAQGALVGVFAGLAIVAILTWREIRMRRAQ